MIEWFKTLNPIIQAIMATGFNWFLTATGAAFVFFFKTIKRKVLDAMLGFAAGVMIAASYWSLLAPSIAMAEQTSAFPFIPAAIGFLLGGLFLRVVDRILPHLHLGLPKEEAEGIETSLQRSILLILAITIHNVPEGLAVGVAFGAFFYDLPYATLGGAIALSLGIGIQNFPEGTAVAVPLRREGFSRMKAFWYGQLSAIVEPVAGMLGAIAIFTVRSILPYALAFAAGAMIFVVIEELIPESQLSGNTDISTLGAMVGFTVMMILDVALG